MFLTVAVLKKCETHLKRSMEFWLRSKGKDEQLGKEFEKPNENEDNLERWFLDVKTLGNGFKIVFPTSIKESELV